MDEHRPEAQCIAAIAQPQRLLGLQFLTENSHGPDESNFPMRHLRFILQPLSTRLHLSPPVILEHRETWPSPWTSQEITYIPHIPRRRKGLPVSAPHCANTGHVQPQRGRAETATRVCVAGVRRLRGLTTRKLSTYYVLGNVLSTGFTAISHGSYIFFRATQAL